MNICIVTRNIMKGDGQSRVNYEIAWEAIRRGHSISLVSSHLSSGLRDNEQVHWINIPVNLLPTQLISGLVFSWLSAAWLRKNCSNLDIVMVNGANTREQADVNAVHFVHTSWLHSSVHPWQASRNLYGAYQWLFSSLNTHWERIAFQKARSIVAVSEKVKQELMEIGLPSERIHVILNGVDLQEFSPGTRSRQKLGLPKGVTLALFVGDIQTNRKNLDTVLHALGKVPDLHLAVAGDTQGSPYPQLAESLKLSDRVHFLGFRCDVSEIMKAVDFFVFPSRYEACTLVLLEAIATGLPAITAITAGGAEIITPESGIVLSDSEDTQALAEALSKLSSDSELRLEMGKAARRVAEQYSWARTAQSYVELFEELAGK